MEQYQGKYNLSKSKTHHLQIGRFLFFILSLGAILTSSTSCNSSSTSSQLYLPTSVGALAEMVVIYDQHYSNNAFKNIVKETFEQPVHGLPDPSEPAFKVLFSDESYFKNYFKEHHNIFILLTEDNLDVLQETYSAENKDRILEIMNNPNALGFGKKDVWAENQNVFYVTAKNREDLIAKLKERSAELLAKAEQNEMETAPRMMLTIPTSKDTLFQTMMEKKGYAIRKPSSYRIAVEKDNFIWLRKESRKYNYEVIIYETPYTEQEQFTKEAVIARSDEVTKANIPGESEGSYMSIDTREDIPLELYFEEFNFKNHYAVMMKGWWRVANTDNAMAGPFVLYSIYDEKAQRIITVQGFVYGPNESKVKPLRELEVLLNSLQIK